MSDRTLIKGVLTLVLATLLLPCVLGLSDENNTLNTTELSAAMYNVSDRINAVSASFNAFILVIIIIAVSAFLLALLNGLGREHFYLSYVIIPFVLGSCVMLAKIAYEVASLGSHFTVGKTLYQTLIWLIVFFMLYSFVYLTWYFFHKAQGFIWGGRK